MNPMNPMTRKVTTEDRLDRAVTQLMRNPDTMWLLGILVLGTRTLSDSVPTAATDGLNEIYNPGFVGTLTDEELEAVLLHEVLHKAYMHLLIWRHLWEEDAATANRAMDYVINLVITDLGYRLPKVALLDPQYRGMDTAEVYAQLRKQQQQQQQQQDGNGQGDSGNGNGQQGNGQQPHDHHDWEHAKSLGQETQAVIERALRQGEMAAKYAGHGDGMAERLGILQPPKVNWKQALAEFLTETIKGGDESTWRRPSRRGLAMGMYLPSRYSEQSGELVLAIDTSGSVEAEELGQMLAETASLCQSIQPARLHLLYWGSTVVGHEIYTPETYDTLITSTRPQGGGGTDARCVQQWLTARQVNASCVILLTDGYLPSWPTFAVPTLWAITTRSITAPSGRTIHIEEH